MPLNATELLVVATKTMRLSEKGALIYMEEHGEKISRDKYYRILGRVSSETRKRLFEICKNMKERHMQRIDELETIRKEIWEVHNSSTDDNVKLRALKQLREIQPWISAYDESTASIIKEVIKNFGQDSEPEIPSLSTLDGRREKGKVSPTAS